MFLVQICFKSTLKQDLFTLKEYKQLFSLPRNLPISSQSMQVCNVKMKKFQCLINDNFLT